MRKIKKGPDWHKEYKPKPAHSKRVQKLPSEKQKSLDSDPEAAKRTDMILSSPNYRIADCDVDFFQKSELKGVRLQVDYFKAELLFQEYGIDHTVVVFGGTRIVEKTEAQKKVKLAHDELHENPTDKVLQKKYKIALKILEKSHFYEISREFGQIVGKSRKGPNDNSLTLMTGGGPGVMEAANRGAFDVGAKSIGLNITLPQEQYPNPYITPELAFQFHYFSMRKLHFFRRAKALVAFPGGYGTLDELMEALTLVQTRKMDPFPIILVGKAFWENLIDFEYLLEEGLIDYEDHKLFWFAETAQEIWQDILQWHKENNTPLI